MELYVFEHCVKCRITWQIHQIWLLGKIVICIITFLIDSTHHYLLLHLIANGNLPLIFLSTLHNILLGFFSTTPTPNTVDLDCHCYRKCDLPALVWSGDFQKHSYELPSLWTKIQEGHKALISNSLEDGS